uniref:Transmembrane protein 230-like n=1 Tax=Xiphophorus maculatus TaxID=8083 RepID=A0A3B5QGP1_XIPMA
MLTAGLSNNKAKYSRLAADDDGYIDLQFKKSPPKIPYKAIGVAVILFLIGSLLIILGALFLAGIINVEQEKPRWSRTYRWLGPISRPESRPHHPCHRHRPPGLPARLLPPQDRLLRRQGLPRLLLR